jgi:hypothetical protein
LRTLWLRMPGQVGHTGDAQLSCVRRASTQEAGSRD